MPQNPAHPDPVEGSNNGLEKFRTATRLLGGQQATARALGMSERSLRYLLDGTNRIHTGILEDISKALIAHADQCRMLERQLNPAFAANAQGSGPPLRRDSRGPREKL